MTDHRWVLPDGRTVHGWSGGDPAGRPVLLCHGTPDGRLVAVSGEGAARAAGVSLVAASRPGYGESTFAAADPQTVAQDLSVVLDLLGVASVDVVGMSVGGVFAQALAAMSPERVRSLTLVACPPRPTGPAPSAEEALSSYRGYLAQVGPLDAPDGALADRFLALLPEADAAAWRAVASDELVARAVREAHADERAYLQDCLALLRPWPFEPSQVRCPVRLVAGERDARHGPEVATDLAAGFREAEVVVRPTTHLATLLESWPDVLRLPVGIQDPQA